MRPDFAPTARAPRGTGPRTKRQLHRKRREEAQRAARALRALRRAHRPDDEQ